MNISSFVVDSSRGKTVDAAKTFVSIIFEMKN